MQKYSRLYPPTVNRIVDRGKLHQIWGAFYPHLPDWSTILNRFQQDQDLNFILKLHSSTAERLPYLSEFYQQIFEIIGETKSILDCGCGLNPLAIPKMRLPAMTKYYGFDIDQTMIEFINQVLKIKPVANPTKIFTADIFQDDLPKAETVFMFKLLPLLEIQQKGSSLNIINKLSWKNLVVSFPTASLSGYKRNMADFYTSNFLNLTKNQGWQTKILSFAKEVVIICRGGQIRTGDLLVPNQAR